MVSGYIEGTCHPQGLTNLCSIVRGTKNKFGCTVVSGADIRNVRLIRDQNLGASEITELENTAVGVEEKILGLDISVTDALRVDVRQGSEKLVDVKLDLEDRHGCLHLVEKSRGSVDGLGHELLNKVQVNLIFL